MSLTFAGAVPVPAPQSEALHVLITGAARGIGFELVKQYADAHAKNLVFAAVRDPSKESSKPIVALAASHPNVHVLTLDVASPDSITASVSEVQRVTDHLDIVINNAAETTDTEGGSALTASAAAFESIFRTNVTGTMLVTRAYIPFLRRSKAQGGAKSINISSALGSTQYATLFGPTVSYGVSKTAVNYLTVVLAHEVPDVTFLSIHPGLVLTDMAKSRGIKAPTSVQDSVQAIRYYTAENGLKSSGKFLDMMTGKPIPY